MTIAQLAVELDQLITSKMEQFKTTGMQIKVMSKDSDKETRELLNRKMVNIALQLRPVLPLVYAKFPHYVELFEALLKRKIVNSDKDQHPFFDPAIHYEKETYGQ